MEAPGVIRLRADYLTSGVPCSMTFRFRTAGQVPPTSDDCERIADLYGLWENSGFGVGYALLRSSDTAFTRANAWSEDARALVSFTDTPFERRGLVFPGLGSALTGSLAPLIHWGTQELGSRTGRTYAVGISMEATKLSFNADEVNVVYRAALTTIFRDLRDEALAVTGLVMVLLTTRGPYGSKTFPRPLDITDVGCDVRLASQRRRLRPG